jgi:hypothetical protein
VQRKVSGADRDPTGRLFAGSGGGFMDQRIAALSPQQAQQAVRELFDLLPRDLFDGGKPTLTDLDDLAKEARDAAPPEVAPFMDAMLAEKATEARGEVARLVLDQAAQTSGLRDYVDEALRRAAQPHMDLLLLAGVVVLAMIVVPKKIKFKDGKLESIEWGQLQDGAKLMHEVTGFVKALPSEVKSALFSAL